MTPQKFQTEAQRLVDEYGYESKTGRILFSSPFFKLACKEVGISWKSLTRLGKAVLKAQAIDIYNREASDFKPAELFVRNFYNK